MILMMLMLGICHAGAAGMREKAKYHVADKIYIQRDSRGFARCYANGKMVMFHDECMDGGVSSMKTFVIDRYAYVVGSLDANVLSFAGNFMLYRIDTRDFSVKHIGVFAAILFGKDGFSAVTAKVINPDAPHSADWKFDMRECYYNAAGTMVRKGKRINGYKELERKYGLSLINAKGLD